jgi:tetratricopeptide (TPR) repeat protein
MLRNCVRMSKPSLCISHRCLTLSLILILVGWTNCSAFQPAPAAPQTAPAAPPPDPKIAQVEGLVTQADQFLQNANWDQAIALANQAIGVIPESPAAYLARGRAYNGKGEYDKAIKDFDWVATQPPKDLVIQAIRAAAYTHRSFALYEKGQYLPAVDSAYLATLEKGDYFDAHFHRARAYVARSEWDKAIRSLDRAIQISPNSGEAYSERGFAYGGKGNFDQCIADQKKALELNQNLPQAFQRRGAAFLGKKDFEAALRDLQQALTLKPDFADALCDRALLHAMRKDMATALTDLDSAIRSNPKLARAHYLRGQAYISKGDPDAALKNFDQAINLKPDAANYCGRGFAYIGKKDFDKAAEDFTKALEIDPKMINAYTGRIQAFGKLNKMEEAKADRIKLKELQPKPASDKTEKKPELPEYFAVKSKPVDPNKKAYILNAAKEVDKLVEANYAKYKITPNPKTSEAQFLRRVYLDVTGTIPTYIQTRKYLSSTDPDKRTKLIDHLLNSDAYASHFFNYWADVLRYKDNLSNDVRGEGYRQWIKQSLAENKTWNRFVYEIITSEGRMWENPATGYFQRDPGMPLDAMNNTVRIFLGTRIGCAQCHDHPFDKWKQREFYEIAAFTFGTHASAGLDDTRYWQKNPNDRLHEEYAAIVQEEEERRQNSYRFDRMIRINSMLVNDKIDAKITLPKDYAYDDAKPGDVIAPKTLFGKPAEIKPGEPPRKAFARWLVGKDNPRFALTIANRLWKQVFGIGQIEPVDDMMDSTVAENPELMKFLEAEIKRLNFDMKEYLRILLNSETYQRQACFDDVPMGEPYHFPGPILRRMSAEQVWDSFLTLSGNGFEYREPPAKLWNESLSVDLNTVAAPSLLEVDNKMAKADGAKYQLQSKFHYKGVLLARASELPSPSPANHFLRMFGQSDRELISASSTTGSVPQILFMFNGPISHMLLEKDSTIYNNIMNRSSISDGVKTVFMTILTREPDEEEMQLAVQEVKQNGPAGYGNVVWSLVNTREFLFIQ